MLNKFILLSVISLTFLSCNSQKKLSEVTMPKTSDQTVNSTYPTEKPDQNILRLVEKQKAFLKEPQMNVTFKRTVADSRCPMNARCVWAGNATVEVEFANNASTPVVHKLSVGDLRGELASSVVVSGYRYTLQNLYPSNSTEVGFAKLKGKYVIDLKFEKL